MGQPVFQTDKSKRITSFGMLDLHRELHESAIGAESPCQ
jgi:hypothetical protein